MARSKKRVVNQTQAVTTGSTLRMEQPSSSRKSKPRVTTVVVQELNPVGGFLAFLRSHAIISLAVGFVIATQLQAVVKQLISSFINPLYALLFNSQQLSNNTFTFHWHGRQEQFGWGAFAYAVLDFLFVVGAIYAVIKILHLDSFDQPKETKK